MIKSGCDKSSAGAFVVYTQMCLLCALCVGRALRIKISLRIVCTFILALLFLSTCQLSTFILISSICKFRMISKLNINVNGQEEIKQSSQGPWTLLVYTNGMHRQKSSSHLKTMRAHLKKSADTRTFYRNSEDKDKTCKQNWAVSFVKKWCNLTK